MRGGRLGKDTGKGEQRLPREAATGNLVSIDPPGHSELRRIVSRGFTPRTMQAWRPRIDELVEEMLGATHGDRLDVVASLASPLPVRVIAELLGADAERAADFRDWAAASPRAARASGRAALHGGGREAGLALAGPPADSI